MTDNPETQKRCVYQWTHGEKSTLATTTLKCSRLRVQTTANRARVI